VQVGQYDPSQLNLQGPQKLQAVLDFFIFMVGSGDSIVAQPHIRANMGDALFYAYLPEEAKHQRSTQRIWPQKGAKELVLETSPLSQTHLVPALMRLYGDVQVTGYYQVAAHRQLITKILGYLWTLEPHRPAFRTFAETSLRKDGAAEDSAFVKLANGILNQTNSNVAESLAKLREIRKTQLDMKNTQAWAELPEDVRNQRTVLLESNEKEVSACLMMANDATDMLSYLSTDPTFVKAFTVPALRARLVDMLCNIMASLGSKKAAEFKIENPEKYNFFPKKMLEEVFQTLLNCARVVQGAEDEAQNFVRAVGSSAYYDYDTFMHAAMLVRKHGIVADEQSLDLFTKFVEDCEKAKREALAIEEQLGEIPDDFLDPLMSTLMEDPVILPGSKVTVDRSTIMHHLLQNSNDPFDRSPLDASMLKEDTSLKEKIQAWKSSKRG
jgi:ubiquitin conjugation factor E4 B